MKKHISLLLTTALLTATIPALAENTALETAKTVGSFARHAVLTSAGLAACTVAALTAHTYTAARLVNTDAASKMDNDEAKDKKDLLLLADPIQNASAFVGSVTGIAGATAVFNGIKGMVNDFRKLIQIINEPQEKNETKIEIPTQPLSHSKKIARIALHTAQLLGGMGTTVLGTFATVGTLGAGISALNDAISKKDKQIIKIGMSVGTNTGIGLSAAGIATMVYGIKGLYNDYNQL